MQLGYDYQKLRTSMRYFLHGRRYFTALRAMEFGLERHTGLRKDGKTPEFFHQMFQSQFARTLEPSLLFPEETIATVFLHDVVEDCGVSIRTIYSEFGERIGDATEKMTNRILDSAGYPTETKKPKADYYSAMINDPVASIAKGIDRTHNHQSMIGVFDLNKQRDYITEGRTYILPMLKSARKRFPEQEPAYQNVKHMLLTQMDLIWAMHAAAGYEYDEGS